MSDPLPRLTPGIFPGCPHELQEWALQILRDEAPSGFCSVFDLQRSIIIAMANPPEGRVHPDGHVVTDEFLGSIHPDDLVERLRALACLKGGEACTYRIRYRQPGHGWVWHEVRSRPLHWDHAGVVDIVISDVVVLSEEP